MDFLSQLHPKIIHFPIAFFLTYALLEIIGVLFKKEFFSKAAHLFLFLGVLGSVAAVLTGNSAEDSAKELLNAGASIQREAIENHQDYATFTMWYFTGLLVLRTMFSIKKAKLKTGFGKMKFIFVILAIIGSYLIYQTADYGGKLVYKYGIGTSHPQAGINKPGTK